LLNSFAISAQSRWATSSAIGVSQQRWEKPWLWTKLTDRIKLLILKCKTVPRF